jgi:hypothetical protein
VKRGAVLERTCWITDVVPTIRYLTGLPMPRHAEGAVIYQAREDPEAKFGEGAEQEESRKRPVDGASTVSPQVGDKINKALERIATKQLGAREAMKQAQAEAIEDLKRAGVPVDA